MENVEKLDKIIEMCKNKRGMECSKGNCPYSIKVVNDVVTYWGCAFSGTPDQWKVDKLKEKIDNE